MKKFIFIVLAGVFLSGCASLTPPPPSPLNTPVVGGKIALQVVASENPKHTHVGTTIFNNFTKEYEYNWNMKDSVYSLFKNTLENKTSLPVIDFDDLGITFPDPENTSLVIEKENQWLINEKNQSVIDALRAQNITTVILINEMPTVGRVECGSGGCSYHYSNGYGLFTRSFLGMTHYNPSASFGISMQNLDPIVNINRLELFGKANKDENKNARLKTFSKPADFKNLTEAELAQAKKPIIDYLQRVADLAASYLRGDVEIAETK